MSEVKITAYNKHGFKCIYYVTDTKINELAELLIKQGYTSTKDK